jgi:mRNA-degrading endonuclease RelE of RelBE toxin-antitoxin system
VSLNVRITDNASRDLPYRVKPKAEKDLKAMSPSERKRVVERLRWLEEDLRGDVKHLSNHIPEYRMRAGD